MADNFKYVQTQSFALAGSGAIIGDTSITLKSFTGIDGANLTMSDFGTLGTGTLQPNEGTSEESISFTGVVQNSNGTATLTGVKNEEFIQPGSSTSGLLKTHAGSTAFVISNTSKFYDKLTSKDDDETITGTWTFTNPNYPRMDTATPAPTADEQLATKKYVDDTAIAGSPKATNAVYGITKLSVAAVSAADPIAVGDNDTRVPTQGENDALAGTSGTPSSTNKYVTNDDTATAATASKVARRLSGGNITVVTESANNNTTNAASTAYVDASVATAHIATTGLSAGPGSSTTQTITHGLGRTPSIIRLYGVSNSPNATLGSQGTTYGVYSSSGNRCVFVLYASGGVSARGTSSVYSISLSSTTGTGTGVVGNVGATTFDIVWTVASGVTDTDFIWECQ